MSRKVYVFADWEDLHREKTATPMLIGELSSDLLRGKEHFRFSYDKQWLNSPFAQQIVLRAIGASPLFNLLLIELEVLLLTLSGIAVAMLSLWAVLFFGQDFLIAHYGLFINVGFLNPRVLLIVAVIVLSALVLGLIPAISAYRRSLQQGLTVRQ